MEPLETIAVDPGASGGVAWTAKGKPYAAAFDPTTVSVLAVLAGSQDDPPRVVIEKVHSSPQMGVASAFSFGHNAGYWEGAFAAAGVDVEFVRPVVWQKGLDLVPGAPYRDRKRALRAIAAGRFPGCKVTMATADALLILDWAGA